jgi:hypothetical protein
LKFCFFHLMPFTGVKDVTPDWPTPNRFFEEVRGRTSCTAATSTPHRRPHHRQGERATLKSRLRPLEVDQPERMSSVVQRFLERADAFMVN